MLSMRLAEISKGLPSGQADTADELALLARLASSLEQEVEVHRLRERQRMAQAAMNTAATEALAGMVADPAGKIVRPDFGRKS